MATCGPYAGHLAGAAAAIAVVMQDASQRFDEGRLTQSLMLTAWARGVGSCIGSLHPDDPSHHCQRPSDLPDSALRDWRAENARA